MKAANKVLVNTAILYGRMLFTMGISLYSTRLILDALGSTDFGIFNLIAGVIAVLSFLNSAMSTSTQRFLSYYQGRKDMDKQKEVFRNSFLLHFFIGIFLSATLEFLGSYIFDGLLNIPLDRMEAAKAIYHFMSISVFFTVISVPFSASLIAHENMLWVAIVSIVETLLKLATAFILISIDQDKLIVYGIFSAGLNFLSCMLYGIFCVTKYEECSLNRIHIVNKKLMQELASFVGWNLFGSICGIARTQGLAVLLNVFYGTVVNAAYGIANQISSQLTFFSATLLRTVNPQIMKSEGMGDRERMLRLAMIASKFGFFLLAIVAIPCLFEMSSILALWLKKVPENTIVFCDLIIISTLINQLTIGLQSAFQATGKVKRYQIIVGSIIISNLPIAYVLLNASVPAYYSLISFACIELIACSFRLILLKNVAGLSVDAFFKKVIFKEIIPVLSAVLICFLITNSWEGQWRFLVTLSCSGITFMIAVYFAGLCEDERVIILNIIARLREKLTTNNSVQGINI